MKDTDISQRIRNIMEKLGLTQKEFAHILGVTQPAISNYINGRIPPGPVLVKIAHVGSVSLEWLLIGEMDHRSRVSDFKAHYTPGDRLAQKIDLLPAELQRTLERLIDQISGLHLSDSE